MKRYYLPVCLLKQKFLDIKVQPSNVQNAASVLFPEVTAQNTALLAVWIKNEKAKQLGLAENGVERRKIEVKKSLRCNIFLLRLLHGSCNYTLPL